MRSWAFSMQSGLLLMATDRYIPQDFSIPLGWHYSVCLSSAVLPL